MIPKIHDFQESRFSNLKKLLSYQTPLTCIQQPHSYDLHTNQVIKF